MADTDESSVTNSFYGSNVKIYTDPVAKNSRIRLQTTMEAANITLKRARSSLAEFSQKLQEKSSFDAREHMAEAHVGDSLEALQVFLNDLDMTLSAEGLPEIDVNVLAGTIDRCSDPLTRIRVGVDALNSDDKRAGVTIIDDLESCARQLDQSLSDAVVECRRVANTPGVGSDSGIRDLADRTYEALVRRQLLDETRDARDEAVKVKDQAREALESAREAAGETGSTSLAHYYSESAARENTAANTWRILAVVTALAIVGLSVILTLQTAPDAPWSERDIFKLAATVPLAALAAYLGRESSRHRARYTRARETELQLRTLPAFIAPLEVEQQNQLRLELGRRVFSSPSSESVDSGPSVSQEAGEVAGRIADAARSLRGGG